MKSMRCSESMNIELKNYLDPRRNIVDIFGHFERSLDERRYAELEANFRMTQTLPTLIVDFPILKYTVQVYTPTIYKMLEAKYLNGLSWQVQESSNVGDYEGILCIQ